MPSGPPRPTFPGPFLADPTFPGPFLADPTFPAICMGNVGSAAGAEENDGWGSEGPGNVGWVAGTGVNGGLGGGGGRWEPLDRPVDAVG